MTPAEIADALTGRNLIPQPQAKIDAASILRRIDREKIAHEIARYVTGTDNAWPAYLGQADAIILYLTAGEAK